MNNNNQQKQEDIIITCPKCNKELENSLEENAFIELYICPCGHEKTVVPENR